MKPKPLSSSYQATVPSAPSAIPAAAGEPAPAPSGITCPACGPRSPSTTRKATRCPSVTTPPVTMAELCTKMSGPPPSGDAKPYPLPGSYQLTVPSRPTALPVAASAVTRTRSAWGPRSFSPTLNTTAWPSRSTFAPPSPTISEACTNTSGEPSSGARKPKPRSASNQRTVPCGIEGSRSRGRALAPSLSDRPRGPSGRAHRRAVRSQVDVLGRSVDEAVGDHRSDAGEGNGCALRAARTRYERSDLVGD